MARIMSPKTTRLYRTLVRKLVTNRDGEERWNETVYGPYDSKAVNRDYDNIYWGHDSTPGDGKYIVSKQELKPTFVLTPMKGLVLGLEWVTYEENGKSVHEH